MLKIATKYQATSTAVYFTEDKGLNEREKIGVWTGSGCEVFGVAEGSQVTRAEFLLGLQGEDMQGRLLYQRKSKSRRCAWDTVFAPDKSISVAALCLDDPVIAPTVRDAFDQVSRPLTSWMERMTMRSDYYSAKAVPTENLTVARFTHETSRHEDPHLHHHLLFLNATWDRSEPRWKNKWRAVEPAHIYRTHALLDQLANRNIAQSLHKAGFAVSLDDKGVCTLPIPRAICERLSKAHASILRNAEKQRPPDDWSRQPNELRWRNYLNDRMRPPKRSAGRRQDFHALIQDQEEIAGRIRDRKKDDKGSLNREIPKTDTIMDLLDRDLYKRSAVWSHKDRWAAATRVALAYPLAALEPIIDAALALVKAPPFFAPGWADHQAAVNAAEFESVFLTPAKKTRRPQTSGDSSETESIKP